MTFTVPEIGAIIVLALLVAGVAAETLLPVVLLLVGAWMLGGGALTVELTLLAGAVLADAGVPAAVTVMVVGISVTVGIVVV